VFVWLGASSKKCKQECPMSTSQRETCEDAHVIAVVELDMQRMRVRIVLAQEAIRERMRELDHPADHH